MSNSRPRPSTLLAPRDVISRGHNLGASRFHLHCTYHKPQTSLLPTLLGESQGICCQKRLRYSIGESGRCNYQASYRLKFPPVAVCLLESILSSSPASSASFPARCRVKMRSMIIRVTRSQEISLSLGKADISLHHYNQKPIHGLSLCTFRDLFCVPLCTFPVSC